MPTLPNPRQEAFAQARARGVLLEEAYERAGFVAGNRHGARLAREPEVAERIGELLAAREAEAEAPTSRTVIDALLRLAEAAPGVENPDLIDAARRTLLEAHSLIVSTEKIRAEDRQRYAQGF